MELINFDDACGTGTSSSTSVSSLKDRFRRGSLKLPIAPSHSAALPLLPLSNSDHPHHHQAEDSLPNPVSVASLSPSSPIVPLLTKPTTGPRIKSGADDDEADTDKDSTDVGDKDSAAVIQFSRKRSRPARPLILDKPEYAISQSEIFESSSRQQKVDDRHIDQTETKKDGNPIEAILMENDNNSLQTNYQKMSQTIPNKIPNKNQFSNLRDQIKTFTLDLNLNKSATGATKDSDNFTIIPRPAADGTISSALGPETLLSRNRSLYSSPYQPPPIHTDGILTPLVLAPGNLLGSPELPTIPAAELKAGAAILAASAAGNQLNAVGHDSRKMDLFLPTANILHHHQQDIYARGFMDALNAVKEGHSSNNSQQTTAADTAKLPTVNGFVPSAAEQRFDTNSSPQQSIFDNNRRIQRPNQQNTSLLIYQQQQQLPLLHHVRYNNNNDTIKTSLSSHQPSSVITPTTKLGGGLAGGTTLSPMRTPTTKLPSPMAGSTASTVTSPSESNGSGSSLQSPTNQRMNMAVAAWMGQQTMAINTVGGIEQSSASKTSLTTAYTAAAASFANRQQSIQQQSKNDGCVEQENPLDWSNSQTPTERSPKGGVLTPIPRKFNPAALNTPSEVETSSSDSTIIPTGDDGDADLGTKLIKKQQASSFDGNPLLLHPLTAAAIHRPSVLAGLTPVTARDGTFITRRAGRATAATAQTPFGVPSSAIAAFLPSPIADRRRSFLNSIMSSSAFTSPTVGGSGVAGRRSSAYISNYHPYHHHHHPQYHQPTSMTPTGDFAAGHRSTFFPSSAADLLTTPATPLGSSIGAAFGEGLGFGSSIPLATTATAATKPILPASPTATSAELMTAAAQLSLHREKNATEFFGGIHHIQQQQQQHREPTNMDFVSGGRGGEPLEQERGLMIGLLNNETTTTTGLILEKHQDDMKLARKRHRNRIAADKCRRRKLERIAELELQVNERRLRHRQLQEHADRLRRESDQIKLILYEHHKAGCLVINNPEHQRPMNN